MARNEEKHYCRLNRALLQQEKEEQKRKNPKRPRLDTLVSVSEIKQWIPSIKKDIEFCLAQSQVPCYPERKIADFQSNIQKLEQEFKAFVRKTKQLGTNTDGVPWTNRPYKSQNKDNSNNIKDHSEKNETFVPIRTPILDDALSVIPEISIVCEELSTNDKPLTFFTQKSSGCYMTEKCDDNNLEKYVQNEKLSYINTESEQSKERADDDLCGNVHKLERNQKNLLGLDYSSDSDSEEL